MPPFQWRLDPAGACRPPRQGLPPDAADFWGHRSDR
ncbi:hypothetical protein EVA_07842 [gut metagenome]|uniref:Uncharacterized protein n=1 Tax=gut metagenome TaxID=749906 RepID=J9CV22_9ZZZZ